MRENILVDFVEKVLNDNNTYDNARVHADNYYPKAITQWVVFERNHREQYNKLLQFCAENNLTVVSTLPATLSTIVRIDL